MSVDPDKLRWLTSLWVGLAVTCGIPGASRADESGASAWLPGQFASFAAVPGDPGFALEMIYYRRYASASASRTFSIGGGIVAGIDTREQYVFLTPSYTFSNPVLRGQLAIGVTFAPGWVNTSVWGVLTGPGGGTASAGRSDSMTGIGDIYPIATLKRNVGSHNFMTYARRPHPRDSPGANRRRQSDLIRTVR